jgi:asparagine synthase (glutamine-hydrolysing)
MCGITGFTWEDKDLLRKMTDIIAYRGPDDHGYYTDSNVSLGHRRLSIIDLSPAGHQPMTNEDGSVMIIFNGEIYNFKELVPLLEKKHRFKSDTDTEVLIHGYEEWGPEGLLKRINGMFAFAIWDSSKKQLFIARDRIGVKPLYYTMLDKTKLMFASEVKAILENPDIKRKISIDSLNSFLKYRFIPSDNTMLQGIKKLLPGHYLIFNKGRISISKYWDIKWNEVKKSESILIKEFRRLLEDSVEMRLMSDVPLGAFLSGGLDSSAVVAINSKLREDPVKTFTVGFGHESDEFKHARLVAEHLGCDHHEITLKYSQMTKALPKIVWHMDEPNTDITMFPLYFLAKESRKYATVINTGEGADELFAGYQHYLVGSPTFRLVPKVIKNSVYKWYYSPFDKSDRKQAIKGDPKEDDSLHQYLQLKSPGNTLNNILLFDIKNELPNWQLTRVDRMTMAVAQEARVPFLDYRLVEFSANLPQSMKIKNLQGKYLVKQAVKDLLPESVIKRYKQGFTTPMHEWLKQDLLPMAEDVLSKTALRSSPISHDYVEKLFSSYRRSGGQKPFVRTSYQIIVLLLFEEWRKQFVAV